MRNLGVAVLLGALSVLAACAGTSQSHNSPSTRIGPSTAQVLSDVIEYTYMVPGAGQLQAIRLSNFVQDILFEACGQDGPPLNDTSGRIMQHVFPDLTLIRQKGLIEYRRSARDSPPDLQNCALTTSPVEHKLPARADVLHLTESWIAIADDVQHYPRLVALKKPMWRCMTSQSGLEVRKNVPSAYLDSVNQALSAGSSYGEEMKYSRIYADCARQYFQGLASVLRAKRPALVERNREYLEQFAVELIAAGYVP